MYDNCVFTPLLYYNVQKQTHVLVFPVSEHTANQEKTKTRWETVRKDEDTQVTWQDDPEVLRPTRTVYMHEYGGESSLQFIGDGCQRLDQSVAALCFAEGVVSSKQPCNNIMWTPTPLTSRLYQVHAGTTDS